MVLRISLRVCSSMLSPLRRNLRCAPTFVRSHGILQTSTDVWGGRCQDISKSALQLVSTSAFQLVSFLFSLVISRSILLLIALEIILVLISGLDFMDGVPSCAWTCEGIACMRGKVQCASGWEVKRRSS